MPSIFKWSKIPANNANSDPDIDWQEGQFPGTVNNSARALEAAVANARDDQAGQLTTAGAQPAYTLATNSVLTALVDGIRLHFVAHALNSGAATLNVDGLGAKPLRKGADEALSGGDLVAGAHYIVQYDQSADSGSGAWILPTAPGSGEVVTGTWTLSGDVTPAQLTTDVNDYSPTGAVSASTLRLSSDATRTITGLGDGWYGRMLLLVNIGTQLIRLSHENVASLAANRFAIDRDCFLPPGTGIMLRYDGVASRWAFAGARPSIDEIPGDLNLIGVLTPAQLIASVNDYSPTGLADASSLRLSGDTAYWEITGLAAQTAGRVVTLQNVGSNPIVLKDESTSSLAANRFALQADYVLRPDGVVSFQYDGTSSRWRVWSAGQRDPFSAQLLHVRDEKPSGTPGGTFNTGAWRTRDLNTIKTNEIIGSSLAANQITLPAGTYHIYSRAPSQAMGATKTRIQNITDLTTIIEGSNTVSSNPNNGFADGICEGRFSINGTKIIELQHRSASSSQANTGFGEQLSLGTEVYSEVMIWKLS